MRWWWWVRLFDSVRAKNDLRASDVGISFGLKQGTITLIMAFVYTLPNIVFGRVESFSTRRQVRVVVVIDPSSDYTREALHSIIDLI